VYARSTTITADPSTIDRGVAYVRDELMPALVGMDGCAGLSLLVDRGMGRCIATSSWQTEEAMRASADGVRALRDDYIATFGGKNPTVEEWEVALMHRDHASMEGACARTSWLQGDPASIDGSVEALRSILPTLDALPGFCSASLLIHRDTGRAVATVVYDSADAVVRTRGQANALRTQVAQQAGADVLEVAEFELAVAHLRVPELV
jgi:hypothetical protein